MTQDQFSQQRSSVKEARSRWLDASQRASNLAFEMFQPGSGYGDPDAWNQDKHYLETARAEAERLFREYHDLDRQQNEMEILRLQRSQTVATWASFAVAAVVGIATVVQIVVAVIR